MIHIIENIFSRSYSDYGKVVESNSLCWLWHFSCILLYYILILKGNTNCCSKAMLKMHDFCCLEVQFILAELYSSVLYFDLKRQH